MNRILQRFGLAAIVLAAAAAPAFAHLNPAEHGSFMAGLSHPLFGLDHVLAMVAVGLWAAIAGGRAVYLAPLSFVGTMVVGFLLALAGAMRSTSSCSDACASLDSNAGVLIAKTTSPASRSTL